MLRRIAGPLFVAACLSYAGSAAAQSSGVAQSLFEEGVRLMREKKYAEACPKLAESHKLEPGGGTIFNLALCLEQEGKLASAYVAFDEALGRAKKDNNKQRAQLAEERMAALKPKLSRVTISVTKPEADEKLDVRLDGTPLGEQAWGIPFYADVGMHTLTAEAPGYRPWKSEFRVDTAAKPYEISVPALEKDPNAAVAGAPPPVTNDKPAPKPSAIDDGSNGLKVSSESRGVLPWILVTSGVVLIGAGTVTGVLAFSKHSDSDAECPNDRCSPKGVDLEKDANTFAWISNVTIPVGVIAAAVGTYLFIKSPGASKSTSARIAPTSSGAVLYGTF